MRAYIPHQKVDKLINPSGLLAGGDDGSDHVAPTDQAVKQNDKSARCEVFRDGVVGKASNPDTVARSVLQYDAVVGFEVPLYLDDALLAALLETPIVRASNTVV